MDMYIIMKLFVVKYCFNLCDECQCIKLLFKDWYIFKKKKELHF